MSMTSFLAAKMFKRSKPGTASEGQSESPYVNGRRAWNTHVGGVIASRDMAWLGMIGAMLIAVTAVGSMAYVAMQSTFVPYMVEVDSIGNARGVGVADRAPLLTHKVVNRELSRWIENARMVTLDVRLQNQAINAVYANLSTNDPATTKMNEWYRSSVEASPFERAKKILVSTEVETAIPQSDTTWEIVWTEVERDRQSGSINAKFRMRALVTYYQAAPTPQTTEENLVKNPLGVFIKDFNWAKLR
ncbi:type IV secretion system protein VirB5 [Azospirillum brasilense]|nr:type IV secretion system protein VirB5 [Azospirillum brasilense]